MARSVRKKGNAVPLEFIQEINKMTKEEIVRRFIQEENDLKALQKIKKEDHQLTELAELIKSKEEDIKDLIIEMRERMKAIREEDEELVELIANKKALESGYRNEWKRRKACRDYIYETMQRAFQ